MIAQAAQRDGGMASFQPTALGPTGSEAGAPGQYGEDVFSQYFMNNQLGLQGLQNADIGSIDNMNMPQPQGKRFGGPNSNQNA